ncbi:MAG: CMP deaminase, partial [Bacteroidales bacterium]|nr:CMP deaminase [Bacteroidales bacterium]
MTDYKEKRKLDVDLRYMKMAYIWSENSYCQRRRVGALLVKDQM